MRPAADQQQGQHQAEQRRKDGPRVWRSRKTRDDRHAQQPGLGDEEPRRYKAGAHGSCTGASAPGRLSDGEAPLDRHLTRLNSCVGQAVTLPRKM